MSTQPVLGRATGRLSSIESRVCASIEARAADMLQDLKLHVGLPTGGRNTAALDETRERLCSRLTALGARRRDLPGDPRPDWLGGPAAMGSAGLDPLPSVACESRDDTCANRLLIAGHLDTVHDPAGPFRELSIAPGGKTATGPGCVDMKGGLVIAVAALEAIHEAGASASWTFFLNSDEETGSYHSARALGELSTRHDFGLALEPALPGGELAVERLGSGQFMVECRGRSAHVGRDFKSGVSAVTALARNLVAIAAMPDPDRGKIVSVGPISGGVATNAVPDLARAWGNARFPTEELSREIQDDLSALRTASDALPATEMHMSFSRPAKPLTPETERLALAARGVAEDLGQRLPFAATGGVCDGNIMQAAGLPTIDTLGVRGGGLHTPDEWIELASLVERCQMLAVLVMRLCNTPD